MADDIDDLLDEVESKYVKDRSKEPRSSNTKPQRKRTEDEEEVDQMIEDICGDTEPLEKCNIPKSVPSNSYQNRPSSSKCFPVFMGGSNCPQGYANSFNKRACNKLRCTSCDFQVVTFEDFEWHSSVDYLFLRNNVPDFHRLKSKLCRKKGTPSECQFGSRSRSTFCRSRSGSKLFAKVISRQGKSPLARKELSRT